MRNWKIKDPQTQTPTVFHSSILQSLLASSLFDPFHHCATAACMQPITLPECRCGLTPSIHHYRAAEHGSSLVTSPPCCIAVSLLRGHSLTRFHGLTVMTHNVSLAPLLHGFCFPHRCCCAVLAVYSATGTPPLSPLASPPTTLSVSLSLFFFLAVGCVIWAGFRVCLFFIWVYRGLASSGSHGRIPSFISDTYYCCCCFHF